MPRKSAAVRRKTAAEPKAEAGSSTARRASAARGAKARLRDDFRSFARAAILSAAEEVLAEEGLHAGRIEEVAQRARVAVGTIYNLVGDRDALVMEILRARHAEVVTLLAGAIKEHKDKPYRDQVHAVVLTVFTYFADHWRFFRLVMEAERAAGGGKLGSAARGSHTLVEIRKLYRELIQRGVKQGALRAEGSELFPSLLSGLLRETMIHDLESRERTSPEQRAALLTRMFFEGAGT
ncbi:MAG TPA: helix-turn-helix domain-containing protein [Polyangiales bacterium]|nr:helix-turn-helix domain-containing protein [Polyangiales bacterium]